MNEIKKNYKDGVFRRLFNDEEEIRKLYNALSGSNYPKGVKVEIVTLDNSIMGDLKNDLAFIIDDKLIILIEHQSTINPNMPLRMLCYLAKEYEKLYFTKSIYSRQRIMIPTPELYVFYNGKEPVNSDEILKLSDSYMQKCDKISLEVKVKVIDINCEKGAQVLRRCRTLGEYSHFINLIRIKQSQGREIQEAIEETIAECMRQGVLNDFLKQNGGDIVSFLYEELTREECEAIREEDGYVRGVAEGRTAGKIEGKLEGKIEDAKKMKNKGLDIALISEITELTTEEIEKL